MDSVYRGVWINWEQGVVRGATLTVSERDGALLISFIATFVTICGAQLWRIISYAAHQTRSTSEPRDGLHHQQQAIFRNASTPGGAAWSFLLQFWYWRGRASHHVVRTLPWTVFGITYLIAFATLSTFSSQVSKAVGSTRLIRGDNCGLWMLDTNDSNAAASAFQARMTNESVVSSTYARACYGSQPDPLSCGTYPVPALEYTVERNASCPFAAGTCINGDTAAFKLTTNALNSHHQLGINAPAKHRVEIHKEAVCAPVRQLRAPLNGSIGETDVGTEGHLFIRYYYGDVGPNNYTFQYDTQSMYARIPYTVNTVNSYAPHNAGSDGWSPIEDLSVDNADLGLIFIAPNSIRYVNPVDDPVFSAHYEIPLSGGGTYFEADEYNAVIGCTDTYRICDPNDDNKCTERTGARQIASAAAQQLELNFFQRAIVDRAMLALMVTNIHAQLNTRQAAALRASELVEGVYLQGLPANQWEVEMTGWFESGLARLQYLIQEMATGPAWVTPGSHVWSPGIDDPASLAMCYSQMINDSLGTASFSVLGLAIVFSVGGVIIATSLILEMLVGWLQTLLGKGTTKKLAWAQDDKLQMQRLVFERAGLGMWENRNGFPITGNEEKFRAVMPENGLPGLRHSLAGAAPIYYQPVSGNNGSAVTDDVGQKDSNVFTREISAR